MTESKKVSETRLRLVTNQGVSNSGGIKPTPFSINYIDPGKANWFREHIHEMSVPVLQRHYADFEAMMAQFERGNLPLTNADRMEIAECLAVISERLDDLLPKMSADIQDHDRLSGYRTTENWPEHLPHHTKLIHFHFCELVHAWNLNPFRRDTSTVTIDETAETYGISRVVFSSNTARNDFLDYYALDDFVVRDIKSNESSTYFWVELTNKFHPREAQYFLDVYKSAMNTLAVIHDERIRAIRHEGGKIGFITVDHFNAREVNELMRIKQARMELGAGKLGKV